MPETDHDKAWRLLDSLAFALRADGEIPVDVKVALTTWLHYWTDQQSVPLSEVARLVELARDGHDLARAVTRYIWRDWSSSEAHTSQHMRIP